MNNDQSHCTYEYDARVSFEPLDAEYALMLQAAENEGLAIVVRPFEVGKHDEKPSLIAKNATENVMPQLEVASQISQEFSRASLELERVFNRLKSILWFKQQNMPTPVITIQSSARRRALGWFVKKAWTNGSGHIPEINICAEHLSRPVTEIIGTLVHEMVHLSNFYANDRDCSGNNYHNRRFKALAERVLLICERAEDGVNQYGWAYTTPTPELCKIIDDLQIDDDVFAFYRDLQPEVTKVGTAWNKSGEATEPKLKKWSCGCTNVWSAIEVHAVCMKPACGRDFQRSVALR